MRDLTTVIDALVAVEPDLAGPLASVRASACFAAPETAGLFWAEAQEVIRAVVAPEHPRFHDLLAIWTGREAPPDRRHVFIYLFANGTIKTSRASGLLGDPKPRFGPARGAVTILQVTPEGRCIVRKDMRANGYDHGHLLDEVAGLRLSAELPARVQRERLIRNHVAAMLALDGSHVEMLGDVALAFPGEDGMAYNIRVTEFSPEPKPTEGERGGDPDES